MTVTACASTTSSFGRSRGPLVPSAQSSGGSSGFGATSRGERGKHIVDAAGKVPLNLEVPESQNRPAGIRKLLIRYSIPLLRASNLGVPVGAGLARGEE